MSQLLDYAVDQSILVEGDLPAVQLTDEFINVTIHYSDIDADDVTLGLLISSDKVNWDIIENSEITVDTSLPRHRWDLAGFKRGSWIKPYYDAGSATDGTIDQIKYMV